MLKKPMKKPRGGGWSLIELMVTLAVLAVLLGIAVPAYLGFVAQQRITSKTNEFVSSVQYARTEAIRRNRTISICSPNENNGCEATNNWSKWVVVDLGADGGILRTHVGDVGVGLKVTMAANGGLVQNIIQFDAMGSLTSAAIGEIRVRLCFDGVGVNDSNRARDVIINTSGRPRIERPVVQSCG